MLIFQNYSKVKKFPIFNDICNVIDKIKILLPDMIRPPTWYLLYFRLKFFFNFTFLAFEMYVSHISLGNSSQCNFLQLLIISIS